MPEQMPLPGLAAPSAPETPPLNIDAVLAGGVSNVISEGETLLGALRETAAVQAVRELTASHMRVRRADLARTLLEIVPLLRDLGEHERADAALRLALDTVDVLLARKRPAQATEDVAEAVVNVTGAPDRWERT